MPKPLRAFAENQPFTPMVEAIRGRLSGTPTGKSVVLAVARSMAFAIVGYVWRCSGTTKPLVVKARIPREHQRWPCSATPRVDAGSRQREDQLRRSQQG